MLRTLITHVLAPFAAVGRAVDTHRWKLRLATATTFFFTSLFSIPLALTTTQPTLYVSFALPGITLSVLVFGITHTRILVTRPAWALTQWAHTINRTTTTHNGTTFTAHPLGWRPLTPPSQSAPPGTIPGHTGHPPQDTTHPDSPSPRSSD